MGGGLMQLVAYGAQDVYLTGDPQITFFKVVYRRHTNFAIEAIGQTFNGSPDFGKKVSCPIQRNGDLITKMHLKVELGALTSASGASSKIAYTPMLGHAIIDNVELDIGGSKIDKQYGDWMNIWYELARNSSHDNGYDQMIGNTSALTTLETSQPATSLFIPLQFFCCRNDGLALPLIALQYHDVRVNFEFRPAAQCIVYSGTAPTSNGGATFSDTELIVDYIYLDSEERKRFAQASHEYLIEQLQVDQDEAVSTSTGKYRLNFNHPCKALFWAMRLDRYTTGKSFFAYNPNDWNETRDIATKRFVLAVAGRTDDDLTVPASGEATLSLDSDTYGTSGLIYNMWAAIQPVRLVDDDDKNVGATGTIMSMDNILYTNPLPWKYASVPLSTVFASADAQTSSVVNDKDVVLYVWNNYALHLNYDNNPPSTGILYLNGHERFEVREGKYFNYVQPYNHFSNTPKAGVNVYSFALHPEDHQPSGTCNMSRIDNATLQLAYDIPAAEVADDSWSFRSNYVGDDTKTSIYTMNYNVLRIMSGMGGMAYSN